MLTRERTDQKQRTRQDLLQAATRLMKKGLVPTLAEVAEEAMVSRATAYRYFSSDEALLADAPLEATAPTADQLFSADVSIDPEERLLTANAALREVVWGNQTQFRLMLARSLEQAAKAREVPPAALRLNRRTVLIEAALAPVRDQFDNSVYGKLCAALALVLGTESMVAPRSLSEVVEELHKFFATLLSHL